MSYFLGEGGGREGGLAARGLWVFHLNKGGRCAGVVVRLLASKTALS